MKITSVKIYQYELAYNYGLYVMSQGRSQAHQPALVVKIETDDGLIGWGETCFLGRAHLQAYVESERAALTILGQCVLGSDPREPAAVQATMACSLLAGMGAKSAIDIACWDILGKASGLSLSSLLGGRMHEKIKIWESVPLGTPEAMADYVRASLVKGAIDFQIKVGNNPHADAQRVAAVMDVVEPGNLVVADANGGWNLQSAIIAAREMSEHQIYLEQPCKSMTNCAQLRRLTDLPFILDECVITIDDLVTAKMHAGAGGVNIKPSRVGGLTPARTMRDVATELGMMVTIDDTWGGALITAALSHLAVSTKPDALLAATFFTEWTTPLVADSPRRQPDGYGIAPTGPGLGVEVEEELLGEPVATIQ